MAAIQRLVVRVGHISESLDIHLVQFQVLRELGIRFFPVLHRTDTVYITSHDVGRSAEITVSACHHPQRKQECREK